MSCCRCYGPLTHSVVRDLIAHPWKCGVSGPLPSEHLARETTAFLMGTMLNNDVTSTVMSFIVSVECLEFKMCKLILPTKRTNLPMCNVS